MRILVGADVAPDPDSGAAGTVYHTNRALRDLGHEVDEIWADDLGRKIEHGNLHYLLELPYRYRDLVAARCAEKSYDVIQLSQPSAWLAARDHRRSNRPGIFVNRSHGLELMADAAVSHWHRKSGIPEGKFPRSLLTAWLRRLLHRQTPKAVRYSDGIIVPAGDIADFLRHNLSIPEEKVRVIHHGVPDDFVRTAPVEFSPERLKRILYVGQFAFFKGPHFLARTVNEILRKDPEATMTWVCSARHHGEAGALIDPAVMPRVRFRDWMPQQELVKVLDRHGIFLFPSIYEGAGKACLEAMARGLAVVASDVGAMRDHIRNGENGIICPVGKTEDFAKAAAAVLNDLNYGRRLSRNARKTAMAYSWRKCAEGAVSFYRHLLGNAARVPGKKRD